ncbi:MAG: DEAD/DEAH box helicase [Deltaproteobacteria bacterium]|nr:DEAD/DEAH box helicase [Deltaproteobacteria bacterium]
MSTETPPSFSSLGLAAPVLEAVNAAGYEAPSPIQAAAIPPLVEGRDVLGQAQTGTGKTAAFALPTLSRLDLAVKQPQVLVLTPTRELAIQVAEAMQSYARGLKGFHVLPVYGGQSLEPQLRQLKRGVHAVVGTPGRIQDHLRRGTLKLDGLKTVVLDEADEMLRMGFIDDVDEILQQTPIEKQVALFSATMPTAIRKVAQRHLRDPIEIRIKSKTTTVSTVNQRYWRVAGATKLEALTRILEVEDFDGMLIFVRTKTATVELSEKLEARGFTSAPLNGDLNQTLRERTVGRLRSGKLDIVVATDVAARGLDVERISHVVNFDIPYDVEAYVHRIGRTGRAGREGQAILFVSSRERHLLLAIERSTRQQIEKMYLPSQEDVASRRINQFKQSISETIDSQDLTFFKSILDKYGQEQEAEILDVAAALAFLLQKERPLQPRFPTPRPPRSPRPQEGRPPHRPPFPGTKRSEYPPAGAPKANKPPGSPPARPSYDPSEPKPSPNRDFPSGPRTPARSLPGGISTARYRIEVGSEHGVQTKNVVGAIANEAGLDSRNIGRIEIYSDFSTVDLPEGMPREILRHLKSVRIFGQELKISLVKGAPGRPAHKAHKPSSPSKPRAPRSGGPPMDPKKLKGKKLKAKKLKAKKLKGKKKSRKFSS